MSLFQNSVLNKYLKGLAPEKVEKAYQTFTNHFHNKTIQENIRNSKEEQYQGEFLIDIFVNVLGYTKNPTPNFNLTTELKNIKGSKKTDGAILKGAKALGVIELKGTNTTDLSKVETQAFGYKNNQPGCNYVITSNFEKLRFYIDNAVDFEEFNLFQLTKERFNILWLCLSSEYLLKDIPKKIKDESLTQEENVTKKLYKDYASFRNEIFDAIQKENPQYDKLTLFKKTQKLLDRFLFIFFAEDRLLLPPNSIRSIVNQWTDLRDKYDEYFPLYDRFKKYFGYMNTGHKGQQHDIFAYNGGLFAPDDILDNIIINDDLLHKHTVNLSNYDFESEVSVNILGHIFEHSLNDIDEIQAEIQGITTDQSKTKRKKDGVFYTPKYITKYIVDNTVGKLCEEKKTELDIQEAEYEKERKGRKKATLKILTQKLENYRKWLLQITICDPACGSGAFLIQALDFLIKEHQYIDELQAKLFGDAMVLSEVENSILEHNLFGVDINDESVEIAKLSLWLRTAQKGRKLTALNNNIKCGNSLIDDPTVAGDKAFHWQNEFKEVFAKGGFDVIIGNPPYVRQELFKDIKPYLQENYKCYNSVADLYTYFIEQGINLMNKKGLFSFILPNKFLKATYGKTVRKLIKEQSNLELLLDFDDYPVFADATTYPIIYVLNKKSELKEDSFLYAEINKRDNTVDPINLLESRKHKVPFASLTEDMWNFIDVNSFEILNKLEDNSKELGTVVNKKIYRGITTGRNEAFVIDSQIRQELISKHNKNSEIIKVLATGKEVKRNTFDFQDKYLLFTGFDNDIPNEYPDIQKELDKYKEALIKRYDQGENYWNLRACAYYEEMQQPKIIYPRINNRGNFYLDEKGEVFLLDNNFFISTDSKAFLALLNSKLVYFYLKNVCTTLQGGFYDFRRDKIKTIPINNNFELIDNKLSVVSDILIDLTSKFNKTEANFVSLFESKFSIAKPSKKLQNWHDLEFGDFLKELKKQKVQLSLSEEAEWMQYFNEQKEKAQTLKATINKTDNEIDQMVYQLYGLSEEEIKIVEEATA
ncbi:Eco57I restriction-modification methylase domain-containing protein [Polaribacter litorisediminis]|uniref:Eco57I restriction-modification methylase domain-containing protein n=1 Tax=Polaribacter litorisediminis TaxID=1908341 RepID=UPI001CBB1DE5|nr:N-6 DNA methylase [Polaribacter litorisediminis]UAM99224.1 Eco57I restriction-modification methylase domain-containing protein [Polaribacter litorisediminis]